MITSLEGYPFGEDDVAVRLQGRVRRQLEGVHGRLPGVLPCTGGARGAVTGQVLRPATEAGLRGAALPHRCPARVVTTSGVRVWEMASELVKPADLATRSGILGPWDQTDLGELAAGNQPGQDRAVGPVVSFQFFPNFAILIWEAGWYNTHQFWPTSHNTLVFEGNVYSVPAKSAGERVGREMAAVSFKEYSLQDANTLEATQLGLEARVHQPVAPQRPRGFLVRHFTQVVARLGTRLQGASS